MTSYIINFWTQEQKTEKEIPTQILKQVSTQLSTPDILDELKKFHSCGKLKKTNFEIKSKEKVNEVWKEVLENRKRILKLNIQEETLEDKVNRLDSELKELKNLLKSLNLI
jgi:vacuolar-type H+-ATPase subunit I/STV1